MSATLEVVPQRSEMDLFLVIEGSGGLIHSTARGIRKENIEETSGRKDIDELQKLQLDTAKELTEKYGIILPPEGPKRKWNGDYSDAPPAPEGKRWYWPWYQEKKQEMLQAEYDSIICSACAFSSGDINELSSRIPCTAVRGSIYNLNVPFQCGMVDYYRAVPEHGEWTRDQLLAKIREKAGEGAVETFLVKEKLLTEKWQEGRKNT